MTTKHSTGNSTKRSSYIFLPWRDASSQDKASAASGSKNLSGFTLVELMVAMCVSLMLLGGVVSLFGTLGESVNDSKSNSEMLQTMRHAARQLQSDLGNVSLVPDPAQTMINPQGFFEYVEGPFSDRYPYDPNAAGNEPDLPDPMIQDVAAAEATGNWSFNSAASLSCYASNNKRQYNHSMGNKSVKWTETLEPGKYQVSMTWPTDWKFNSDGTPKWPDLHFWAVPVTISSGDNSQTVDVDQTQKPSDLADPEATREKDGDPIMWHHLGQIDVGDDGQLAVQIGPYQRPQGEAANKQVYADAIRIECLELTGGGGGGGDNTEVADSLPLMGDCDDVLHFTTKTDEGAHEVVWFLTPMKGHENKSVTDRRYRLHRYENSKVDPHLPTTGTEVGFRKVGTSDRSDRQSDSLIQSRRYERISWAHSQWISRCASTEFDAIPARSDDNLYTYGTSLSDQFSTSAHGRCRRTWNHVTFIGN